jgi:hypothetical protein
MSFWEFETLPVPRIEALKGTKEGDGCFWGYLFWYGGTCFWVAR